MWGGADEVGEAKIICSEFVRTHPNIRLDVSVYPWGQYWTKVQTEMASGIAPDLMTFYSGSFGTWAARGALAPLNSLVQSAHFDTQGLRSVALENCTWDKQLYAIPTEIANWSLVYSKDRLEERGIPPSEWPRTDRPMTWEQFLHLADQLTLRNAKGSIVQFGMTAGQNFDYVIASMFGGNFFDRQVHPTVSTILSDPKIQQGILAAFQSEYGGGPVLGSVPLGNDSSVTNSDSAILQPKFCMGTTGPWGLAEFQKAHLRFGISPMPIGDARARWINVNSVAIAATSKHQTEAFEFLQFLVSPFVQNLIAGRLKGVPALRAADPSFIHNQAHISGCEAFLYDVDHSQPMVTTDVSDCWAAVQNYFTDEGQILSDADERILTKYQNRYHPMTSTGLSEMKEEMQAMVNTEVQKSFAPLDAKIKLAFQTAAEPNPSFFTAWIAPLLSSILLIGAIALYVWSVQRNNQAQDSSRGRGGFTWGNQAGYRFLSPWLAGLFCFTLGPLIAAILLSFTRWNMVTPPRWVGFQQYLDLSHDAIFWLGLHRTFSYALYSIPIGLFGGLFTAGLLASDLKGSQAFKAIFYVPSLFTGAEAAVIWVHMLSKDHGVVNEILGWFHIAPINWLDASHAFYSVILMNFFWVGSSMIIYYAGMKQIPQSYYEAAELDGASSSRKFIKITIPLLSPVILFLVIIGTIGAFQVFTPALFFASSAQDVGKPGDSLRFYAVNIYDQAFNNLRMGTACAYAVVLFLIVFAITLLQLKLAKRFVYTEVSN